MSRLRVVLEMIKFEHTVFALPFAFLGAFLAARGFPGWEVSFWILLAMIGARSSAMAMNRLADQAFDALNPRTRLRALPQGQVSATFVILFIVLSSALFFISAWMLNPLAFLLSPLALFIIFAYSYTKRFTSWSHLFLGLSLAIAPVGGWIATRGTLELQPFVIAVAVMFWVGGFDIIYACQDFEFDRRTGLKSLPVRFGIRNALYISIFFHLLMIASLLWALYLFKLSLISFIGMAIVAAALIYEHNLVKPDDLSKVNAAFFTLNGVISIVLLLFVGLDLCLFV